MFVDVGSARLFFDVVGEGLNAESPDMAQRPSMILLHGGPGYDHSTLRPYFDRYSDTHQLIYLDHRGCGRSTGDKDSWHLDQWADDLAAFCKALGIESPVVFGQSFGGMVAMHYAARHPASVSKLILSSTAAQFRLDETEKKDVYDTLVMLDEHLQAAAEGELLKALCDRKFLSSGLAKTMCQSLALLSKPEDALEAGISAVLRANGH